MISTAAFPAVAAHILVGICFFACTSPEAHKTRKVSSGYLGSITFSRLTHKHLNKSPTNIQVINAID
jgi:hypothetical protein